MAQSPGLEWMGELAARDDVDWQAVQEVHDQWSKSDSGIGGPGMQLVSLAMAVALSWTGVGATAGTAIANSVGLSGNAAMTAAFTAGFDSLITQAGMQVIANGGDVGAALKAMASIDTVRSLTTAMLTAGLSSEALGSFGESDLAKGIDGLAKDLAENTIKAGINTGVGTAINGGNLGENLIADLRGAAVSVLGAEVAHDIGAAYAGGTGDLDYVSHKIAHAALGGAMAAANGGGIASGAIGGIVGEITGEALAAEIKEHIIAREIKEEDVARWVQLGVDVSRLAAGLSAAAAGGDVETAAETGGNAAEHNALCGGICIAALAAAVWGAYATYEGDGNIVEGVKVIGAGDDTFTKLVEAGITTTVEKAYEVEPDKAKWVFDQLQALGNTADAVITFTDEATGEVVSKTWNSLDQETRNLIKGSADGVITIGTAGLGKIGASVGTKAVKTSIVVTAKKSGELFDAVKAIYEKSKKLAKAAKKAKQKLAEAGKDVVKYVDAGKTYVNTGSKAFNKGLGSGFFEGTVYTNKVKRQMKLGDYHSFPDSVAVFEDSGVVTNIVGNDGIVRKRLTIRGGYKGKEGVFEFIKEPDGTINHRLFVPKEE